MTSSQNNPETSETSPGAPSAYVAAFHESPVKPAERRAPWLGIVALVYGAAALGFEIYVMSIAGTVMTTNRFGDVVIFLPFVILIGIVLCIVAGFGPRPSRRYAVIGGVLMILPVLYVIASLATLALGW